MNEFAQVNAEDFDVQQNVSYNIKDLKKEEEILSSLYTKMKDQLHKLEVEELELKQKIRRKELKETTAELFPPPPPAPEPSKTEQSKRSTKGKSKQKRKRNYTSSLSHDEDASELDDAMSVASGISYPSPASTRSVKSTPTRKMPKSTRGSNSPEKFKAARNLTIPMTEPDMFGTELNLSALNALSLPDFAQSSESEDEH